METLMENVADVWMSLPPAAQAMLIVIAGWFAAHLARWILSGLLGRLGFNRFCDRTGLSKFLLTGNIPHKPSRFFGVIAYWLIMLQVLILAAGSLDIALVKSVADTIARFLPSFIAFILISITGLVVASFLGNFTLTVAKNAGIHGSRLISRAVKYAVIALALVSALRQLGVAAGVLENVVSIAFGAMAFGTALAFGLGCKDLARGAMEKFLRNIRESEREALGKDMEG